MLLKSTNNNNNCDNYENNYIIINIVSPEGKKMILTNSKSTNHSPFSGQNVRNWKGKTLKIACQKVGTVVDFPIFKNFECSIMKTVVCWKLETWTKTGILNEMERISLTLRQQMGVTTICILNTLSLLK